MDINILCSILCQVLHWTSRALPIWQYLRSPHTSSRGGRRNSRKLGIPVAHYNQDKSLKWTTTFQCSLTVLWVSWSEVSAGGICWLQHKYIDGLMHDCSISSVLAMVILQFCTKPFIYYAQMYSVEKFHNEFHEWLRIEWGKTWSLIQETDIFTISVGIPTVQIRWSLDHIISKTVFIPLPLHPMQGEVYQCFSDD